MRCRFLLFAVLFASLAVSGPAGADEAFLATLTSSGASVSYTAKKHARLTIQCSSAAYVTPGAGSATATATNGVLIQPNWPPYEILLTGDDDTVAEIPVSGSNTCTLFKALP